jgi:hypothetical protein
LIGESFNWLTALIQPHSQEETVGLKIALFRMGFLGHLHLCQTIPVTKASEFGPAQTVSSFIVVIIIITMP